MIAVFIERRVHDHSPPSLLPLCLQRELNVMPLDPSLAHMERWHNPPWSSRLVSLVLHLLGLLCALGLPLLVTTPPRYCFLLLTLLIPPLSHATQQFKSRIVGCVGDNYELRHPLMWMNLRLGMKHLCVECGQVFQLTNDPHVRNLCLSLNFHQ